MVGRPNSGKTLFALNFAAWAGLRSVELHAEGSGGTTSRRMAVETARALLTGPSPHQTRALQSLVVAVPTGKGRRRLTIVDSTGLDDQVHADAEVRRAMAQTIRALRRADVVLHLMDAAALGEALRASHRAGGGGVTGRGGVGDRAELPDIDRQLVRVGRLRAGYAIVANKMDLPAAGSGLDVIRREFPGVAVLPISTMEMRGFGEVRRFVRRYL